MSITYFVNDNPFFMISVYIQKIREKIGHDFLLLPSVTILVFDAEKKVLLVRHSDNNVWVAPGGMIEPDESPAQAAIREMQEETGCIVNLTKILGVYGGPEFQVQYQNGDKTGYVMIVFQAEIISGELIPDGDEIQDIQFFTFEETKSLTSGIWLPTVLNDIYTNKKFN
jgi:8-oxo-dGTP pyrophosphatase MutT (NUDIX family)